MPELDETEWDKIINNVSMISFMQGLPLKNKYYIGYSVVTNTQSKEFVDPDEIYFIDNQNVYHKITHKGIENYTITGGVYRNIDFKRKSFKYIDASDNIEKTGYYYPHSATACYECIIASTNTYNSTQEAIEKLEANENTRYIKKAYYTALYRERYIKYKSLNFGFAQ